MYLVEQSEQGQIPGDERDGGVHLGMPAPELPFDVSGAAHQLAQACRAGTDRDEVERVQRDEHVDHLVSGPEPGRRRQLESGRTIREHQAVDEPRHVELGSGDGGVRAVRQGLHDREPASVPAPR